MDEQFQFFKRTLFEDIGTVTEDCLINKLRGEYQALCIVNTKKRAQNIYQELKEEGVYHLSTSMYPKHRKQVLEKIRERLREDKKCILISTSLVEAGVDLDFQSVYRELAGVDSMIPVSYTHLFLQCMRQHWLDFIYTNIKWRRKKRICFWLYVGE